MVVFVCKNIGKSDYMYKYFVSYWAKNNAIDLDNGIGLESDIVEFDFKITSSENLAKAEFEIAKTIFGDTREIVIISFQLID